MSQYKKYGIVLLAVLFVIAILSMNIFFKKEEKEEVKAQEMQVYVLHEDVLVEYPTSTFKTTTEEKIMEMVQYLTQGEEGFTPLLQKASVLNDVQCEKDSVRLYFEDLQYDINHERKVVESIVFGCLQFPEIKHVELYVKDTRLLYMPKTNLDVSSLNVSFGINLIETNQLYLHEGNSELVYYQKKIHDEMYEVPRSVRLSKVDDYALKLEVLLKSGNTLMGLVQPLSLHQVVSEKSPYYEDGILHLYMNKNIVENKESIKKDCETILRKSFYHDSAIEILRIHVNENTYDINLRNS